MEEIIKDLTTVETGLIAHGCNCQGAFGSGIAGAIRKKWPNIFVGFLNHGIGKDLLGTIDTIPVDNDLAVINCYTQEFYGPGDKKYADLEAVANCVFQAIDVAQRLDRDLYIAKIGCGLGGLDWDTEVKPLYEKIFAGVDVNVYVCDL